MKTEKLFENNCYLFAFEGVVLSCEKVANRYATVLDKTAFFPEQGGQYADKGSLNGIVVSDVQIEGEKILHFADRPFSIGEKVSGQVDESTRIRRMQTHTGEHILSGVIFRLYGFDNVGFHLGDGYATVDTSGALTEEEAERAEAEANAIVRQDRAVTFSYPTAKELSMLTFRSKIEAREGIRLVTIDGCDVCACCAPHLSSTGQVGIIKILRREPHKGGTRLTIACGQDAYETLSRFQKLTQSAGRLLSATPDTLLEEIQRLMTRLAEKEKEGRMWKTKYAASSMEFLSGKVEYAFIEEGDFEILRALATTAGDDKIRLILTPDKDAFLYAVFSRSSDVRPFVGQMNAALCGKGGGSVSFAQGKLFSPKESILTFLR